MGVVVNRSDPDRRTAVHEYCQEKRLPVLLEIPFRREIASALAAGEPLVDAFPEFRSEFVALYRALDRMSVQHPKYQSTQPSNTYMV
jgi:MinD superfamily P-loop ATPase